MLFVRAGKGISLMQAKKICYPFDKFIGIDYSEVEKPSAWNELIAAISGVLV
jgi:hypothetical protein